MEAQKTHPRAFIAIAYGTWAKGNTPARAKATMVRLAGSVTRTYATRYSVWECDAEAGVSDPHGDIVQPPGREPPKKIENGEFRDLLKKR